MPRPGMDAAPSAPRELRGSAARARRADHAKRKALPCELVRLLRVEEGLSSEQVAVLRNPGQSGLAARLGPTNGGPHDGTPHDDGVRTGGHHG